MEDYAGKTCPYCNTEITEEDEVVVCAECHRPHHKTCWEENSGCAACGCSDPLDETEYDIPANVCSNCGAPLNDDQEFCTRCGTPRNGTDKIVCDNCGAELQEGQAYCPKCGRKVGWREDADNMKQESKPQKKKPVKLIIAIAVALTAVIACVCLVPKLFVSVEELCARGEFLKAYEKAAESEKQSVKIESIVAERCAYSAENLKDPSSFKLREAYYDEYVTDDGTFKAYLVLYISGANSYGASVSSYWLYTWDNEQNAWEYFCSVSDLTNEEYKSYDDEDDKLEKLIKNLGRLSIKTTMRDGVKLSKNAVQRINDLFAAGKLDEVQSVKLK